MVNEFDLTVSNVLPEMVYTYVDLLARLRDNPAGTLFDLLEQADVPLLSDLMAALPSSLESSLEGWLNDAIESTNYQDTTAVQAIDAILVLAQTVLTRFDLVSELDLPDIDGVDAGQASHRLNALRLHAAGNDFEIPIELPATDPPLFVTATELTASMSLYQGGAAQLGLDLHSFGLPYGEYAYQGLEYVVTAQYGMGIRDTLGAIVDCPSAAAQVASKCVLGVCVGHEQELTALCEQGLDLAVEELQSRLYELRFDAVELGNGQAVYTCDPDNASFAQIGDGTWDARIDIGTGLRPAPATFSGTRL